MLARCAYSVPVRAKQTPSAPPPNSSLLPHNIPLPCHTTSLLRHSSSVLILRRIHSCSSPQLLQLHISSARDNLCHGCVNKASRRGLAALFFFGVKVHVSIYVYILIHIYIYIDIIICIQTNLYRDQLFGIYIYIYIYIQ